MENTILENNLSAWEKKFCGSRVEIENKYNCGIGGITSTMLLHFKIGRAHV